MTNTQKFKDRLFKLIQDYQLQVAEIRQRFQEVQSNKYYNLDELYERIDQDEKQIEDFLYSLRQLKQSLDYQLRDRILRSKFAEHPDRKCVQAKLQNSHEQQDRQQTNTPRNIPQDTLLPNLITQNMRLQLKLTPISLHPTFFRPTSTSKASHKVPPYSFKFLAYHIDKMSQIGPFLYDQNFNLRKAYGNCYYYHCNGGNRGGGGWNGGSRFNTKLGTLQFLYEITFRNFQVMRQLFGELPYVHIYMENQYKIITAVCQLDLSQIVTHEQSSSLDYSQYKNNFEKKYTKLLKFKTIQNNSITQGQQLFQLHCQIQINKLIISPQTFQLKQKIHKKRVILTRPARSRSPSPTLHKQAAKALISSINRQRHYQKQIEGDGEGDFQYYCKDVGKVGEERSVVRLVVVHDRRFVKRFVRSSKYQVNSQRVVINQQDNILKNGYTIQVQDTDKQYLLTILVKLQNQSKQGFIQFTLHQCTYLLTITPNKIPQTLSLQQSKLLLKTESQLNPTNPILIQLTESTLIRPSQYVRIVEYPIEQKIVRYEVCSYFFKGGFSGGGGVGVFPWCEVVDVVRFDQEKGVKIYFKLDEWYYAGRKDFTIVFAAKTQYHGNNPTQNQTKGKKTIQNKTVVVKNKNQSISQAPKVEQPEDLPNTRLQLPPKVVHTQVQFHIVKYHMSDPIAELCLYLEVSFPRIYKLDLSHYNLLTKNSKYELFSCNQYILKVCTCQFEAQVGMSSVDVQLVRAVKGRQEILMGLRDLSRGILTMFKLCLMQEYSRDDGKM